MNSCRTSFGLGRLAVYVVLLALLLRGVAFGGVYLSSYSFSVDNLPYIYTDEALPSPYKLRAKFEPGAYQSTNSFGNNWTRLESVPTPGSYGVVLYWLKYDSTGTTILEIGPQVSYSVQILPRSGVNGITWNYINTPTYGLPGQNITFQANVTNSGTRNWGSNHYLELKDSAETHLYYPSLNGTASGSSITSTFVLRLPSDVGRYTYYFTGVEHGVEYFGGAQARTIIVDTPPETSLSVSQSSVSGSGVIAVTSTTTDSDSNLVVQAIDYIPPGGSGWVGGTVGNGTRWEGGPTGSNTLVFSKMLDAAGTWQFRARGADNLGYASAFAYQNVTVIAAPGAPTITSSSRSDTSVMLMWTPGANSGSVVGYQVQLAQTDPYETTVSGTSCSFAGLSAGMTYRARVRGYTAASVYTPWSAEYSITTTGASKPVSLSSYAVYESEKPIIRTDEQMPSSYKLRCKVSYPDGSELHAATSWNNNGAVLEALPPVGTHTITLYWLKYSPARDKLYEIGPYLVTKLTVLANGTTPTTDSDGDGLTDYEEGLLGTDPSSPTNQGDAGASSVKVYTPNPASNGGSR